LIKPQSTVEPERFGRYEVRGLIGDGAMGRVYSGFDPLVKRPVAIKTFKFETLDQKSGEAALTRFRREAQAAGALAHPHIVSIFDVGEDYFVMELLEGKTLQALVEEQGRLAPEEALRILSPVAEALDYAHGRGVIHRDIKPANIMVLPDGRPKLMDFGVAHLPSSEMTKAGEVLGSPSYMAPEQIVGHEVTPAADLFSLATVAYQALTGKKPFQGETVTTVIYRVVHEDPPPPRRWNDALPERYDGVFRKALAKDPAARFPTAQDFVGALDLREFDAAAAAFEDRAEPLLGTGGDESRATGGGAPALDAGPPEDETISMAREVRAGDGAHVERKPPRKTRILLGTGAVLVVAAAAIGLQFHSTAPGSSGAGSTLPPGALSVETTPPGAKVTIDGRDVGFTPLVVPSVAPGLRTLRVVREGYAPAEVGLDVVADVQIAPLRFTLQATEGRAIVHSEPPGAAVTVDGRLAGRTPLEDLRLAPGNHEVRVEADGRRPWRQRVESKAGETVSVEARLAALPAAVSAPETPEPPPPALREGDLVELGADVEPPKRISGDSPAFPEQAVRSRIQGKVVVTMVITEKGVPVDVRIVESAGEILDAAVLEAVETWRFQPARKNGVKVRVPWRASQEFRIGR
jgi:serine/threonine-protein kinase